MRFAVALSLLLIGFFAKGQDSTFIIHSVEIEGNKLTKNYIIEKEITFSKGDVISMTSFREKAARSKQNLINTSLFNFADINDSIAGNLLFVKVKVKERWYTWPQPILTGEDRNTFDWLQYRTFDRFSYGLYLNQYNIGGRQQTMQLKLKFGYSQEIGVLYKIPYLVRTKNHGLNLSFLQVKRHEIYYKSLNDKIVYLKNSKQFMREELNAYLEYVFRFKLYQQHFFRVQFDNVQVADTIIQNSENPYYLYKGQNKATYFSLKYLYRIDKRDSKNYPIKGHDIELEANKYGLVFTPAKINTAMFSVLAEKFGQISSKIYYAIGLKARVFTDNTIPFYIARGFGFNNDFVRGYEPYMISGTDFFIAKSNIKWQLYKPRVYKIKFLPFDKFNTFHHAIYLNLFTDAGYIKDRIYLNQNQLGNQWLIGYGIGLDFVTYYDKVLRIEFSTNKKVQSGIYVSFIAPI